MSTQISNVNQNAQYTCTGKCPDTLCWNCRYATGTQLQKPLVLTSKKTGAKHQFQGCPWATASVAVPGWKAEKTIIKNPEAFGGKQNSYIVYECPHFEPDTHKEPEIEEIIEEFGLPVRYALSNRTILWDYYEIYKMFTKDVQKRYEGKLPSKAILSVKVAAAHAYGEDVEYELENKEITQEEYEVKISAVNTLKEMLVKYHNKTKRNNAN